MYADILKHDVDITENVATCACHLSDNWWKRPTIKHQTKYSYPNKRPDVYKDVKPLSASSNASVFAIVYHSFPTLCIIYTPPGQTHDAYKQTIT